jgi:hypothetical protein
MAPIPNVYWENHRDTRVMRLAIAASVLCHGRAVTLRFVLLAIDPAILDKLESLGVLHVAPRSRVRNCKRTIGYEFH